jgi:predicted RNA binding protein YcfA (HicA-like mRNA interferase family)
MVTTDFSGRDVVKALRKHDYEFTGRKGSHVQLRYTDPNTDEVRNVTVPMYDRISEDILHEIADQCAANDFRKWCQWIDRNC